MKEQGLVFVATAIFLVGIGVIYWFTSYEPSGTVLLLLCVGLGVIPGSFLLWHSVRAPSPLPEDRPDANPDDLTGRVGSFPETSVWPLVLAIGAAMTGIGLVFGVWAGLPGGVVLVIAFVGASLESRSHPGGGRGGRWGWGAGGAGGRVGRWADGAGGRVTRSSPV